MEISALRKPAFSGTLWNRGNSITYAAVNKWEFLTKKATKGGTLVSITNWRTYQSDAEESDQSNDQRPTKKRPTTDQRPTHNKNVEEQKEHREEESRFSPEIENLFALAVELLKEAGHKTPETAKQIRDAKDCIRLMIERDGVSVAEIEAGLRFVASDTGSGNGWPGWRSVIQSIRGFREKFPKIKPQMLARTPQAPATAFPDVDPEEMHAESLRRCAALQEERPKEIEEW